MGAALSVMALGIVGLRRASSYRSMLFAFLWLTVPAAAEAIPSSRLVRRCSHGVALRRTLQWDPFPDVIPLPLSGSKGEVQHDGAECNGEDSS